MTIEFALAVLALGGVVGFAAGLLGIGGGMALAPILTALLTWQNMPPDMVVHAAIATSMATILFTSLSSVRAHQARGNVDWRIVMSMAPGLIVGGLIVGGGLFAVINTAWLALFFALFVAFNALKMLKANRPKINDRGLPGPLVIFATGSGIGAVSGLVGAGGAFLAVPFMTRCGVSIHRAIGTSAALGFPIALASCAGYIYAGWGLGATYPGLIGYIYWPALLCFTCVSVLTAPLGARMTSRLPVSALKRLFACLLLALASYMGWQAVQAFSYAAGGAVSMNDWRSANLS